MFSLKAIVEFFSTYFFYHKHVYVFRIDYLLGSLVIIGSLSEVYPKLDRK